MGFIYSRPLSIEGVFSHFDTDGNGEISLAEKRGAKSDIFTNFKIGKNMTLETFERENRDIYAKYEQAATIAYNKQQEQVKQWLEMKELAMEEQQAYELEELEKVEKELEKEKQEIELKLTKQKAKDALKQKIENLYLQQQ